MRDEESKLYNMKLHEIIVTKESRPSDSLFTTAMRVPGGWVYRSFDKSTNIMSSVFVPFDNEFQASATIPTRTYDR